MAKNEKQESKECEHEWEHVGPGIPGSLSTGKYRCKKCGEIAYATLGC